MASTLGEEELADLRDQFDAIDVDKNGSISLEEMRQVFTLPTRLLVLCFFLCFLTYMNCLLQALAKDLPWKMKDSRVIEILHAVKLCL